MNRPSVEADAKAARARLSRAIEEAFGESIASSGERYLGSLLNYTRHHAVEADDRWWAVVHRSPTGGPEFVEPALPIGVRDRQESTLQRTSYEVKELFESYADAWERATRRRSFVREAVLDLNYQRIIGLGPQAVPLIMSRLRHATGHWFWALTAIVGEDKAAGTDSVAEARQAWLNWFDAEYIGD